MTEKLEIKAGVMRGIVRKPSQTPCPRTLNFTRRVARGSETAMLKKVVRKASQKVCRLL